jgi:hypothetical protein
VAERLETYEVSDYLRMQVSDTLEAHMSWDYPNPIPAKTKARPPPPPWAHCHNPRDDHGEGNTPGRRGF